MHTKYADCGIWNASVDVPDNHHLIYKYNVQNEHLKKTSLMYFIICNFMLFIALLNIA